MIYKVFYQADKHEAPRREATQVLFIEADNVIEVREKLATHTPYGVEYIQEISGAHLEYEQERNPDYEVVEF